MQKNDLGKDKYRAMIEALGEGVLLVTKKHRIALSNKSAEELLSWASPLVGKDIEKIFDDSTLSDAIDSVFKEKERKKIKITSYHSYTGDRAIIRGKGREKHYKSYITSLDDKHVVVTIMDVTRIERLAIVRQDFVSNVSHELKTPLTAISGFAETLLDDSLSREEMKGFARIIQKNSAHMQRIISDLLLLTSLDRSEMATSMAVTTDERILSEVRSYTQYKAESKNIEVEYSGTGKSLICNESLIVQAVVNLVVNAISYSPENTKVTVRTKAKGGIMEFIVSDRGSGIAEENISRIFERFYRVDKARSRESGGTGLGLSIVRHIAIIHNGTIKAESKLGEGSVFTLSIPIS